MGATSLKENIKTTFEVQPSEDAQPVRKKSFLWRLWGQSVNFMLRSSDLNIESYSRLEAKRSMYSLRKDLL